MIGRTVSVIDWLARPTPQHDPFRGGAVALPALGPSIGISVFGPMGLEPPSYPFIN